MIFFVILTIVTLYVLIAIYAKLNEIRQMLLELQFPFLGSTEDDIDYWLRKAHRAKKTLKKGQPDEN